ncbi:MAG TPA: zf-HC2 domain-containing protein [Syntrophobacteraceae bacterium]|nr:zf-HC2 domain-containing protein [Syntrophobacteraceae bacterium]
MECYEIRAILFEHMAAEIPAEIRQEVEAHLAVCRSCAMLSESLGEELRALGTLPKLAAPRDLLDNVRSSLEKPSALSALGHRLQSLFAGWGLFQLASAAAVALFVMVTVQVSLEVALREDRSREVMIAQVASPPSTRPVPPAAAPHRAPASPGSPSDVNVPGEEARIATGRLPAGHGPLPDAGTRTEKGPDAASAAIKSPRPAGNESIVVALALKLDGTTKPPAPGVTNPSAPGVSAGVETPGGPSEYEGVHKPEGLSLSNKGATGVGGGGAAAGRAGTVGGARLSQPLGEQTVLAGITRLVERADGKVLSAPPAWDNDRPGTVVAEVPATNYHSFVDQLRQLGKVEVESDKSINVSPDANVRVAISLNAQDRVFAGGHGAGKISTSGKSSAVAEVGSGSRGAGSTGIGRNSGTVAGRGERGTGNVGGGGKHGGGTHGGTRGTGVHGRTGGHGTSGSHDTGAHGGGKGAGGASGAPGSGSAPAGSPGAGGSPPEK